MNATPPSVVRGLTHFALLAALALPLASPGQPTAPAPSPAIGNQPPPEDQTEPRGPVPSAPSTAVTENKTVVLNPFVVNTNRDRGYLAEDTLSGTRLDTPAKFVGAAITEVTPELMQDLATFNAESIIDFTPNASTYGAGGTLSSDALLIGAETSPHFNIRGLVVTSTSRDFIIDRVADDAYNLDRISIDRGPNSVLFNLGSPGGIVNAVSTQAVMKDSFELSDRFDNWGSSRESFRINQQLIPGKVAVFVAGLDEDQRKDIDPSDNVSHRITGAITIKPTRTTTIRASIESGNIADVIAPPWPADDGYGGWVAAGSQPMPASIQAGAPRFGSSFALPAGAAATEAALLAQVTAAGYQLSTRSGSPVTMLNLNSSAPLPPLDQLGYVQTAQATVGAAKVTPTTLLNSPLPYTANVSGYGNQRIQKFLNYTFNIEQQIGKDLFLVATMNRSDTDQMADRSNYVAYDPLYLDENPTLLTDTGSTIANPNFGRYYTLDQGAGAILQDFDDYTLQLQAAYKFDFREHWDGWLARILGHHSFGALRSRVLTGEVQTSSTLVNLTPQALVGVEPQAGATSIQGTSGDPMDIIHYIDPKNPATWAMPDIASMFGGARNPLFAGSKVPAPNANGVTPGWLAVTDLRNLSITNTQSFVMQDYFWDDRIVPTFGWRRDVADSWSLKAANETYNGETLWVDNIGAVNPRTGNSLHPVTYFEQIGQTSNQGITVYPLKWLGLFYNQSDDFQPASNLEEVNILGQPLLPSDTKGRDWGLKFPLWGNRIIVTLDRYTMQGTDIASTIYRTGFGGTFAQGLLGPLNAITSTMFTLTGNPAFQTYPFPSNTTPWYSTNDEWSKGYELSLTANITDNWRLTANVSKQSSVPSNFGATEQQWYNTTLAYITANYPQYLNAAPIQNGPRGVPETVAQDYQDALATLQQAQTLSGRTDARQAAYTGNFVTMYDFTFRPLKGFGIGGTYQWRTKEAIGYGFQPGSTTLYNPNNVFYGPTRNPIGLILNYKFLLEHRFRVRLQLNADNINMNEKLYPFTETDSGNGTPVVSRYAVGPGKTFAFSTTIDY